MPDRLARNTACVSLHIRLISSVGIVDLHAAPVYVLMKSECQHYTVTHLASWVQYLFDCRTFKDNRPVLSVLAHCMLQMTGLDCIFSCHIHMMLPAVCVVGAHALSHLPAVYDVGAHELSYLDITASASDFGRHVAVSQQVGLLQELRVQ